MLCVLLFIYYVFFFQTDAYSKGQLPVDFKEDRNIFIGRPDTHRFVIGQHMLDTQKMKTWWKKIKTEGGYNFLFNNCCDLVVQALREGGIEIGISLIRTPAEMVRLGRELERK